MDAGSWPPRDRIPMTEASIRRLELGSRIAAACSKHPLVKAVAAYGSAAYGTADDLSDLDLKIYWDAPRPGTVQELSVPGALLNSEDAIFGPTPQRLDVFEVEGLAVSLLHVTLAELEAMVTNVVERCDTDGPTQVTLWMLAREYPLFGPEHVRRWQEQIARYPERLAERMVQEHLTFYPRRVLTELASASVDLVTQLHVFCRMSENIVGVLLGLNRMYGSCLNLKLLNTFIAGMDIVPAGLRPAIDGFPGRDGTPSLLRIAAMIDEVYDLVAAHLPTIDASASRRHFHQSTSRRAAEVRDRLTARIVSNYNAYPGLRAVLLVPPYPLDHASIRLVAYWDAPPHPVVLRLLMARLGAVRLGWLAAAGSTCEEYLLDGVCVAVTHGAAGTLSDLLDRTRQGGTAPEDLAALSDLFEARAVHGAALIRALRSQAGRYADVVARSLVEHRRFFLYKKWAYAPRVVARGHYFYAYQALSVAVENLFALLLASNRMYGAPGDAKRYERWIGRMKIRPRGFWPRLNRILALPPADAVRAVNPLIRETLQLVERHMPDVNVRDTLEPYVAHELRGSRPFASRRDAFHAPHPERP